jgi:hypothetical protein
MDSLEASVPRAVGGCRGAEARAHNLQYDVSCRAGRN